MISDWITSIDFSILNWIRDNIYNDTLDWIVPKITFLADKGWFFIVIAILLLLIKKTRKCGCCLAISYSLGFIFGNMIIKKSFARPRPYSQVGGVTLLVDKLSDYSFPSAHTMIAFEFFAVMLMMPIKWIYKVIAGILAVAIALSRLYLYVHFPSDVIAGAILGFIFGIMGVRILDMIMEERKSRQS
ncbi:MAG: phosphatase PAP2 family protein [Eubacteriales bacterium]|nr:phosphatase PAP2 family protein [Eubacteriales bacterium]